MNRRGFLSAGAATVAGVSVATGANAKNESYWDQTHSGRPVPEPQRPLKASEYRPVITPSGTSLPFEIINGVKIYHLVAEEVWNEFSPGLKALCWGYNGRVHGPTIEGVEGERIRVYVTNRLPAPTSVHWHGVFLPSGMDGVGGVSQRAIKPGETFMYEWTWRQHGTYMYHSHHDEMTQMGLGMMGMIVVHPRNPEPDYEVDKDFAIMLSEWKIVPGTYRPDPNEMSDFNVLTMNGKCFPGTAPLVIQKGDRVRIRFGNLSAMDHHPIHLHGYYFRVSATDGGAIPREAQWPETTVLVAVGSTRDIEFVADEPGDWVMHCHMTHHVMNQMGHDIPNMIGMEPGDFDQRARSFLPAYMTMGEDGMGEHGIHVEGGHMKVPDNSLPMVGAWGPFDYITMGGMFTIVKVRDQVSSQEDPGWYDHPPGTVADVARPDDLRRDGIEIENSED